MSLINRVMKHFVSNVIQQTVHTIKMKYCLDLMVQTRFKSTAAYKSRVECAFLKP